MKIEYYNEKGILKTYSLFKFDGKEYYIFHKGDDKWLLCEKYPVGLLTLLYIPFSKLLNYFQQGSYPVQYFPFNEVVLFALRKEFWARQAITNWLENDNFTLTKELKIQLLQKKTSHLNNDLQAWLNAILM